MSHDTIARRAVVVGSGVAGLFSARVLADHFDDVVLIDRDDRPEGKSYALGVYQPERLAQTALNS